MRILVIEKNARMIKFLEKAFRTQSMLVDVVSDLDKVLFQTSVADYDVIILNHLLPTIGGTELCYVLRERGVRIPIIIISARGNPSESVRALDSGADDFLPIPLELSELYARVRAAARRKESFQKPYIRVGNIVVDCNKKLVVVSGESLALSPKEYSLIEFLAKNCGRALTRLEIMQNVWGKDSSSFSNVVDVHVSNLRSKIAKNGSRKLIRTVRGGGYILDEVD